MAGERYQLEMKRISAIPGEESTAPALRDFFDAAARFLILLDRHRQYVESGEIFLMSVEELAENNFALYRDILPDNYGTSWCNPVYACERLGKQTGQIMSCLMYELRSCITAVYDKEEAALLCRMDLFLEIYTACEDAFRENPDDPIPQTHFLQQKFRSYLFDYAQDEAERAVYDLIVRQSGPCADAVNDADLSDPRYLYYFGDYISTNETETARHMASLPDDTVMKMAQSWTDGFINGFALTGKDISRKRTCGLRYHYGFERMIRCAQENLDAEGLSCIFSRGSSSVFRLVPKFRGGCESTCPNPQMEYDHAEDLALFLTPELSNRRLEALQAAYDTYRSRTVLYAGPLVMETFGEQPFAPEISDEVPRFDRQQQELAAQYRSRASLMYSDAVIAKERSFTIIAWPVPEVSGEHYPEIFDAVTELNTVDAQMYSRIQSRMIDALNGAEYIEVKGSGINRTDLKVMLCRPADPEREAVFENCGADVNIPAGEVFTTPVLKGTDGILHVSRVYLEGLEFRDLRLVFRDGRVADYSCGNYEDPAEGRKYIEENILFHHEGLPMGECAIGTNTTAFAAARRLGIEAKLPILIAEKTGPHFAVGDTCYSHDEDNRVYNPDGKEIIAKDNECSLLRKTDPQKAYFGCHTDITIPYDEIGELAGVSGDGTKTFILRDGRFVLPGTEELNKPLQ